MARPLRRTSLAAGGHGGRGRRPAEPPFDPLMDHDEEPGGRLLVIKRLLSVRGHHTVWHAVRCVPDEEP